MKRVLNLFLAVLLVCTVNGLGDLKAQSNNKVAQLEKLSAIENNPQKTIRKQTAAIRHSLKTAASAESVELFGCMTYSSKWSTSENGEFGIYSFPAEEGIAFTPVKTAADFNLSAAVYADGKFCGYRVTTYGSTVYGVNYYLFDTDGRHSKPRTTTILSASLTIARPKPSTGNSCPKQVRRGSARSTYSPGNQHKWQAPATACTSLCLLTKKGRFTA